MSSVAVTHNHSARCVLAARTSEESAAPVSNSRASSSSRLSDNDRAGTPSVSRPALSSPPFNDRAYRLFLYGFDTFEIARILGITEARAHKRITLERDRLNGTRTEFGGQLP